MLRKLTIFIAIFCILFTIPCYAMNGQASFYHSSNFTSNGHIGVFGDMVALKSEPFIYNINLNPQDTIKVYCCPVDYSTPNYSNALNLPDYIISVSQIDILQSTGYFSAGENKIEFRYYDVPVGMYKLVVYDSTDMCVYEWYFTYVSNLYKLLKEAPRLRSLVSVQEYYNDNLTDTPIPFEYYEDTFSYSGIFSNPHNSDMTLRLTCRIAEWQTPVNADYYELWIKGLSFEAEATNYYNLTSSYVNLKFVNSTSRQIYSVSSLNNVQNLNNSNTHLDISYPVYIPASYASEGDLIYLQFDFIIPALAEDLRYTVSIGSVSYFAYDIIGFDFEDINSSIDSMNSAGNALGNVEKPDISADDFDIESYISSNNIALATQPLTALYNTFIGTMVIVVCILAVLSFIFFGKK